MFFPRKVCKPRLARAQGFVTVLPLPFGAGAGLESAPFDHVPAGGAILGLDQVGGRAGTCQGTSSPCPFPVPWGQSPACKVEVPPAGRAPG